MKKYKIRLFGKGIFGEHIMPFSSEPTQDQVEDVVAILIERGVMELKSQTGFHRKDRWTLTYEEVLDNKKEKQNILGTWV